jgi:hypothetical protein
MRLPDRPSAGSDLDADVLAARLDAYAVSARDLNAGGDDAGLARPADRGRHHALADRLARLPSAHPSAGLAAEREGTDYGDHARLHGESADLRSGWQDDSWDRHGGDPADDLARGDPADDLAQGDLGHDELGRAEPDQDDQWHDAGQDVLGEGDSGAQPRIARHASDTSAWGETGGPMAHRSPYRPWFGSDGVGDPWFGSDGVANPWFAADLDE